MRIMVRGRPADATAHVVARLVARGAISRPAADGGAMAVAVSGPPPVPRSPAQGHIAGAKASRGERSGGWWARGTVVPVDPARFRSRGPNRFDDAPSIVLSGCLQENLWTWEARAHRGASWRTHGERWAAGGGSAVAGKKKKNNSPGHRPQATGLDWGPISIHRRPAEFERYRGTRHSNIRMNGARGGARQAWAVRAPNEAGLERGDLHRTGAGPLSLARMSAHRRGGGRAGVPPSTFIDKYHCWEIMQAGRMSRVFFVRRLNRRVGGQWFCRFFNFPSSARDATPSKTQSARHTAARGGGSEGGRSDCL